MLELDRFEHEELALTMNLVRIIKTFSWRILIFYGFMSSLRTKLLSKNALRWTTSTPIKIASG